jgi:hypothetical protein
MESDVSLPCQQQLALGPYPEPKNTVQYKLSHLRLPCGLLIPLGFSTEIFYTFSSLLWVLHVLPISSSILSS